MTNEEMKKEVQDALARLEGTLNILRSSPEILAYNKLLGLSQRLNGMLSNLTNENNTN